MDARRFCKARSDRAGDPLSNGRSVHTAHAAVSDARLGAEAVAGVVITYTDITERKRIADLLAVAKREADLASIAKSRFLAAASHDLRQPLQTLSLLLGLIVNEVTNRRPKICWRDLRNLWTACRTC